MKFEQGDYCYRIDPAMNVYLYEVTATIKFETAENKDNIGGEKYAVRLMGRTPLSPKLIGESFDRPEAIYRADEILTYDEVMNRMNEIFEERVRDLENLTVTKTYNG